MSDTLTMSEEEILDQIKSEVGENRVRTAGDRSLRSDPARASLS